MILIRFIVSILLAAIALAAVYFGGWVMMFFILAVAVYAQFEMHSVTGINKKPALSIINYTAAVLIMPMMYFFDNLSGGLIVIAVYMVLVCVISVLQGDFSQAQKAVFSFIYPQIFFIFLYAVSLKELRVSQFVWIFTLLSAAMTDTFAFFSGKFFGKHKLCPEISPKKTVEGAIGGIIMGVAITSSFGILTDKIFGVNLGDLVILKIVCFALILSIFSEFGDLIASMIKRAYSVKDFGNLLPGHGGLLDRIDSIIFIMPVAYLLFWNL